MSEKQAFTIPELIEYGRLSKITENNGHHYGQYKHDGFDNPGRVRTPGYGDDTWAIGGS